MSECWTNQEFNFSTQGNLQGHQLYYNDNNIKLNKKTYLNPQIVNYEFIKRSLSERRLQGINKIHVNPNFKGNGLNNVANKNYPHFINNVNVNSQNTILCEPGTSNAINSSEEINSVNPSLLGKNRISDKAIPYQSRFKKVNTISLKNKPCYSWSKNKNSDVESFAKTQTEVPAIKSVINKSSNLSYKNKYKYTSPKVPVSQNCENVKKKQIYKSKTKIINGSRTKLLNSTSPKTKLHFKEKRLATPLKKCFAQHLTKFTFDHHKNSSVLRVAKAVRSKYKYLNNTEQYKKSKYKIDKRKKLPESVKKKSCSKEIKSIKKLFPNNLYHKIRRSYNVYNLDSCRTISKSSLLRKNQSLDKISRKINQFPNRRVVKIGGILYKSTTTKLTIASQKVENSKKAITNKLKAKRNYVVYVRGEKFTLENNGKALRRQFESSVNDKTPLLTPKRIDIGGVTYLRKSKNVLIRTNVHQARHFVNKAKNKSIALLVNLRKRSSMPCMIYHRFGRCIRHTKGLCMYKHDPKNIAVCKKFLKGECTDNNCLLSHQIIQEKMATCHFFLKGLCVKENCPFLHVKLSQKAAICENFLQGFCNLGKECSKRHLHQCPEFDKYGKCTLGSKCHYPHKKLKTEEISDQKRTENLTENKVGSKNESETVQYYIHSGIQKKAKKTKRSNIKPKQTEAEKAVKTDSQKPTVRKGLSINTLDQNSELIECFPKRVKLDKLPCFIPLNSES